MLVAREDAGPPSPLVALEFGWRVLAGIGLVFFVVGGLDIALAWYPLGFGAPAWEFGTVSLSLNGLPLPALGLAMVMASAVALGHRWQARICAILLVLMAVLILMGAIVWATNVPLALTSTQDALGKLGVQRSIVKTVAQVLCYPVAFVWVAVTGWRLADQTAVVPVPRDDSEGAVS